MRQMRAPQQHTWWARTPLRRVRTPGTEGPRHDAPDETLRGRRPLYLIPLGLLVLAPVLHLPLLVVAGLLVGVVMGAPEIWYRFGALGLHLQREPFTAQAVFGDEVEVTLTVENRQPLPLPWVVIEDNFPESLPVTGIYRSRGLSGDRMIVTSTLGLWAYQRVRRRLRVRCIERGAFRFGPMELRLSDPFGLLTREQRVENTAMLLVYPLIAPIQRFGLPAHSPFGESKSPLRLLEDPLRVAGTRPYMPGDEPRRIHWKATARAGALYSKIYEPATRQTVAVFVDVRTYQRSLFGYDPSLAELAISAAASIASWALQQGFAVGVYGNSSLAAAEMDRWRVERDALDRSSEAPADAPAAPQEPAALVDTGTSLHDAALRRYLARRAGLLRLRVPPASNPAQLTRILDGLARLLPYGAAPMEMILTGEQSRLPAGSTIVYIGAEAAVDVPLIVALRRAKAVGHSVTLLLTGAPVPSAPEGTDDATPFMHLAGLSTHRIGGGDFWNALVADALEGRLGGATDEHAESRRPAQAGADTSQPGGSSQPRRALVVE